MDSAPVQRRSQNVFVSLTRLAMPVVLMIAAAFVFDAGYTAVTAPWAVSWMPGPKLIGTWEGPLEARQGARYALLLDLRYADERSGSRSTMNNLAGTAKVCTPTGQIYEYEIYGGVSVFGDAMTVRLTYGDPKLSGLGFDLKGRWQGSPLALKASDNPFDVHGTFRPGQSVSTADPDDSFLPVELRPGTLATFEQRCRRPAG